MTALLYQILVSVAMQHASLHRIDKPEHSPYDHAIALCCHHLPSLEITMQFFLGNAFLTSMNSMVSVVNTSKLAPTMFIPRVAGATNRLHAVWADSSRVELVLVSPALRDIRRFLRGDVPGIIVVVTTRRSSTTANRFFQGLTSLFPHADCIIHLEVSKKIKPLSGAWFSTVAEALESRGLLVVQHTHTGT